MASRKFLATLRGAAATWPLAARAQQGDGVRRVGALSTLAESDLEVQSWIRELVQRLQELGRTNGRNVQVDLRFSDVDAARTSMLAAELIKLRPDVVLASGVKPSLPAQLDATLDRFDIGRTRAATCQPMSPLRSTASNRRLSDMA
jgi:putative ABC transport system substrate-binding protein